MKRHPKRSFDLYILTALSKGFPVFCSVLLPVLYAEKLIDAQAIGYIGATFIVFTIVGAVTVVRWLHKLATRHVLQLAAVGVMVASCIVFAALSIQNIALLMLAYGVMGVASGTALSGVNAITANMTTRGNRFKMIARLSMVADIVRVAFALVVAGLVVLGAMKAAVALIALFAIIFLFYASRQESVKTNIAPKITAQAIKHNRPFKFFLSLEFLDSFCSSQLFVFLPLLFLAKGYSLENSILLQAFTFLGYMSGRWLVGILAHRLSGLKAVGIAEIGLVVSILLILFAHSLWILYVLTFALGLFARGTSPAIKSLAFDALEDNQTKQGSALHVIVGDSGSAAGQFTFGLLVAFYGEKSPFIVAMCIASIIAILCIPRVVALFRLTNSSVSPSPHLANKYS
ncbi:MAG TPA: MFS transporter [Candidatus Saccharimonadales bacterium]|nr:MFS transporter [Candidatus Saccharimonadales bacterium]